MRHLLRSDFYKLRKAKYFWVCLLINLLLAAGTVFLLDFTYKLTGDQMEAQMQAQQETLDESGVNLTVDNIPQSYEDLNASGQMITFFAGNTTLLLAVLISLFVGSEFNNGTIKNIASKNYSRAQIYLSKLIVSVLVSILFTLLFAVVSTAAATILWGFGDVASGFWADTAAAAGLELLLCSAYASVFVMFSMLIRQNGGSLAANICFLEFVSLIVMLGEVALKQIFDKTLTLSDYLIDMNMNALTAGLNRTVVLRSLGVFAGYFLVALCIGMFTFQKRDIR